MRSPTLSLALLAPALALTGCWGSDNHHHDWDNPPPYEADLASPDSGYVLPVVPTETDGGAFLGSEAEPPDFATLPVERSSAGGGVDVPLNTSGFVVTANGQGGYRVAWVDGANTDLRVHGSIYTAGSFSQITPLGTSYAQASAPNRVDFEGQPGTSQGQVDVVSSTDPIWVDLVAGSSRTTFAIYYAARGGTVTAPTDPCGFTSP